MSVKGLLGTLLIVIIMFVLFWLNYNMPDNSVAVRNVDIYTKPASLVRCKDFYRSIDAQKFYDSQKSKIEYKVLDGDHDGKVCESLP